MITPWCMWVDYQVWLLVQMKFMSPAAMIARGAEMEEFMKHFTLNGVRAPTIRKPY